jgi:hypothetical protein
MKSPVMKQLEKLFYRADTKAVPRFTRSGNMTLPPGIACKSLLSSFKTGLASISFSKAIFVPFTF